MFDVVDDAVYETVHGYRDGSLRGANALISRIYALFGVKFNSGTFQNKAATEMPGHEFKLKESILVQLASDNFKITEAYCQSLGGVFVRVATYANTSDVELLNLWAKLAKEEGETAEAYQKALNARRVTREMLMEIERETFEDIAVKLELFNRVKEYLDEE